MRKLFVLIFAVALFAACEKEDSQNQNNPDTIPTQKVEYMPLAIGNYWVYEHIKVDTLGVETPLNKVDSIMVSGDSVYNGHTYYVLTGTYLGAAGTYFYMLRDSSGFIVNHKGKILVAPAGFLDTVNQFIDIAPSTNDTIMSGYSVLEEITSPHTVPAGTFDSIQNMKKVIHLGNTIGIPGIRTYNEYFAPGVGRIMDSYGYASAWYYTIEIRLTKYHIQD